MLFSLICFIIVLVTIVLVAIDYNRIYISEESAESRAHVVDESKTRAVDESQTRVVDAARDMNALTQSSEYAIVFVCNLAYKNQFERSLETLRTTGKYTDDVVLIVGEDMREYVHEGVIVIFFREIDFGDKFKRVNSAINADGRHIHKKFQWHKLHIFNTFFKRYTGILYLDCGMKIVDDVAPILQLFDTDGKASFVARSDAYNDYIWTLQDQFDQQHPLFQRLQHEYDLNIDYPQTGLMMFNTKLITPTLFSELCELATRYPISRTNEQGIIALYFTSMNLWTHLPIHNDETPPLYYYSSSQSNETNRYIMYKIAYKDIDR